MVYIPPVKNNQYDDYADREVKNIYDPFHVGSISRMNQAAGNTDTKALATKNVLKKKRTSVKKARQKQLNDSTISEITGKGKYFNEQI